MESDVLVVDDSAAIRKILQRVLRQTGMAIRNIYEAGDGQEALQLLHSQKISLVLTDINMPKMDGYQVIRAVREDETLWRTPVITISTEDKEQDALKAYDAGANFYLTKPVRPKDLEEMARLLTGTAIR
jgi:two-component system chemotaxis response regulator CheY